jgi:hypothetical protein
MKTTTILLIAMLLFGCDDHKPSHGYLLGTWKSNEQKTLKSMNSIAEVSEESRKLFENGFFGQLVVEYKENESRSLIEEDGFDTGFQSYHVVEVNDSYIKIIESNDILGDIETTMYPDGDCFYVIVSKYEFREYFCRVK